MMVSLAFAWLTLPVQMVDATPSDQLIPQTLSMGNRSVWLCLVKTQPGGVRSDLTPASYFSVCIQRGSELGVASKVVTNAVTGDVLQRPSCKRRRTYFAPTKLA
jgi:hypothetical protein